MSTPLELSEIDPIDLDGILDAAGALQLAYDGSSLANYNQTLHAEHSDIGTPAGVVRVKVVDFSSGGVSWQLDAVHDSNNWTRGSGHAYYDFGATSSEVAVDVTATGDQSPPQTKTRRVLIKISPPDAQPDRPR